VEIRDARLWIFNEENVQLKDESVPSGVAYTPTKIFQPLTFFFLLASYFGLVFVVTTDASQFMAMVCLMA
jgi:hypothetical protein